MGFEMGSRDGLWNDETAELWQWDPALQTWDRAYLFEGCPYRGGGGRDVHGEGREREEDICSSYMYRYADSVTCLRSLPVYLLRNSEK